MGLIVPTVLSRAASEEETEGNRGELYHETSARLLELAAANQGAFRGVVNGMTEVQRGFMEGVIRSGRQRGVIKENADDGEGSEPTIALRMNFGGA